MEEDAEDPQQSGVNSNLADELSRRLRDTSTPPPQADQSEASNRILCDVSFSLDGVDVSLGALMISMLALDMGIT